MQHIVNGLLAHLTLILIALPIAGVCGVALVSRWGEGAIRRVALTNTLLTAVSVISMVATFDAGQSVDTRQQSSWQIQDQFDWPQTGATVGSAKQVPPDQALDVHIAVGIDGLNLWFMVLTVGLTAVAVVISSDEDIDKPAVYYGLLLLLEATLLAAFCVRDMLLFCLCVELSIVPTFFLTGLWGGLRREQAIRTWMPFAFAGSMLVMMGVVTLAMTTIDANPRPDAGNQHGTLLIEDLAQQTESLLLRNQLAAESANLAQLRSAIYLIVWLGIAVQMGVVPFHSGNRALLCQSPLAVKLLWFGVGLKIGSCAIVRISLLLLPLGSWVAGDEVVTVAVSGSLLAGIASWLRPNVEDRLGYFTVHQMSLCMAGLFSMNVSGVAGGLLLAVGHGLSLALFVVSRNQLATQAAGAGERNVMLWMGCMSLAPVPGLATLPGTALVAAGVFLGHGNQTHPVTTLALLLGIVAATSALVAGLHQDRAAAQSAPQTTEVGTRASWQYRAVTSCLLCACLGIGIGPNLVLRSLQPTVQQLLERNRRLVRQGVSQVVQPKSLTATRAGE